MRKMINTKRMYKLMSEIHDEFDKVKLVSLTLTCPEMSLH